jgi:hypothetical protein
MTETALRILTRRTYQDSIIMAHLKISANKKKKRILVWLAKKKEMADGGDDIVVVHLLVRL